MSKTSKIILGVAAGILVLCLCAAATWPLALRSGGQALASASESNPANIAKIAAMIADFTVPSSFEGAMGMHLLGFSVVGYNGQDEHSHIYLAQVPDSIHVDPASLERQVSPRADRPARMQVVERGEVSIRGALVPYEISEGTNGDGLAYRELSAIFQGKGGQALVNISSPSASWDQAMVDSFLASIH